MLCPDPAKLRLSLPSSEQHSPITTGRQRQGKLWSNLAEVCDLLQITTSASVNDEEVLFQHVQSKSGQRVHTIGQAFDYLYVVNSGFLKTVLIACCHSRSLPRSPRFIRRSKTSFTAC
jgi:CRP/FNR family transcriptional regulator